MFDVVSVSNICFMTILTVNSILIECGYGKRTVSVGHRNVIFGLCDRKIAAILTLKSLLIWTCLLLSSPIHALYTDQRITFAIVIVTSFITLLTQTVTSILKGRGYSKERSSWYGSLDHLSDMFCWKGKVFHFDAKNLCLSWLMCFQSLSDSRFSFFKQL